jgi:hypothetical protein
LEKLGLFVLFEREREIKKERERESDRERNREIYILPSIPRNAFNGMHR